MLTPLVKVDAWAHPKAFIIKESEIRGKEIRAIVEIPESTGQDSSKVQYKLKASKTKI